MCIFSMPVVFILVVGVRAYSIVYIGKAPYCVRWKKELLSSSLFSLCLRPLLLKLMWASFPSGNGAGPR